MSKRKKQVLTEQKNSRIRHENKDQIQQKKEFDRAIYQKFINFMNRSRWQKLKERISYFYGRNFPIAYKQKYNFKERWQEDPQRMEQLSFFDVVQQQNFILQVLFAIIMVINVFVIWALTVKTFYCSLKNKDDLIQSTLTLGLISRVISALLHLYIRDKQIDQPFKLKTVLKVIGWDIFSAIFFIVLMIQSNNSWPIFFFESIVITYFYLEARKIYKLLGFITLSTFFQNRYKILDLMVNLIITAHFFSLIIIATTWGNHEKSWIKSIGVEHQDYMTKYIYSFYFCSTTILTVGYGDISPKNVKEICVVTMIQFFGVVFFGYLINQIGFNLSVMRKNEQKLEKDLRTLHRIEKHYSVDKSTMNKTKGYLVNHQNYIDELTPQEENGLIGKLNEELRQKITFQRTLSVIKSSIFFICRWSKDIQSQMALKMQKLLLSPNQRLLQPIGNQRIYLINKGKIDIYLNRFGANRSVDRRLLKTITVVDKDKVCENIYGYTAVISNRPCSLDATASQFTSLLYINKKDFESCAFFNNTDRQYYHEVKANIDSAEFCQAFEAPSMLNIRQHYFPSRIILIRKEKAERQKKFNVRQAHFRNNLKRFPKHSFKNMHRIRQEINDKVLSEVQECEEEGEVTYVADSVRQTLRNTLRATLSNNQIRERLRTKSKVGSIFRGATQIVQGSDQDQEQLFFLSQFQKHLEYQNYFPYNNFSKVIDRLSKQNYMHKTRENILIYSSITKSMNRKKQV